MLTLLNQIQQTEEIFEQIEILIDPNYIEIINKWVLRYFELQQPIEALYTNLEKIGNKNFK